MSRKHWIALLLCYHLSCDTCLPGRRRATSLEARDRGSHARSLAFLACPFVLPPQPRRRSYGVAAVPSTALSSPSLRELYTDTIAPDEAAWGDVTIENAQTTVPVDLGLLERQTHLIKNSLGLRQHSVHIHLASPGFNNQGDSDEPMLVFPDLVPNDQQDEGHPLFASLGEIVLFPEKIQNLADTSDSTYPGAKSELHRRFQLNNAAERLPYYIIRGLLLLIGRSTNDTEDEVAKSFDTLASRVAPPQGSLDRPHQPTRSAHYIVGVGTDILSMKRLRIVFDRRRGNLARKILTSRELQIFNTVGTATKEGTEADVIKEKQLRFIAKRFVAKEAAAKALGLGLRILSPWGLRLKEIEVLSRRGGQPYVNLLGCARRLATSLGVSNLFLTHADEREYSVAFVTAVGSS